MGSEHQYRFTADSRLKDAASYARVFKNARRSRDQWFTVLYRPRPTGDARLGLAISKKNCKKATGRNRIKRIVRDSFRHSQHELDGLDIVVLNQPAAADASNAILLKSLTEHWQRCQRRDKDSTRAMTRANNDG